MTPELPENLVPQSRELLERIGVTISMLFYGINLCLVIHLIAACRGTKFNWMKIVTYSTFILATLFQSLLSYVTIMSSVRNFETADDSTIWFGSDKSRGIQLTIIAIGLLNAWILDSCMLYQCFIVYSIRRIELWIMGLPVLFLISSIGSGAYLIAVSGGGMQVRVLPHFPLCLSTKLVATSLIAFKLLQQRRIMQRMIQVENSKELTRPYTSLIRVLITSYALYSTFTALFLGLHLLKIGAWRIIMPSVVQAGLMSHLLVRSQVVRNRHDAPSSKEPPPFSTTDSTSTSSHQDYV